MEQVLRLNIAVFKILGAWDTSSSKCYRVYRFVLLSAALLFFTSSFLKVIIEKLSPKTFSNAYSSFSCFNGFVRLLLISRKKKLIVEMFDLLKSTSFQPQNEEQKGILSKAIRASKAAFFTFFILGTLLVSIWISRPVLDNERELPVEAWYPFDYRNYYVTTYLWQSVNFFFFIYVTAIVDIFFVIVTISLGLQCDFLLDSIGKLEKDSEFAKIIVHHQDILRFAGKIQELYGDIVLIQFVSGIFLICTSLFLLNVTEIFTTNFFLFLVCLSFMLTQVMLYCWYGNTLIQKSENFQSAAFGTDWYTWPEKSKKELLFFIHRTRKPIAVLMGNVYPTNLPIFLEIFRRSWAFFMALRTMQNK